MSSIGSPKALCTIHGKMHMRIMLVEDNTTFRKTFKEGLSGLCPFATLDEAANGDEALQKINSSPPQMVFMDFRLPGENGLRLIQRIKAQFPNIRIAMVTSYDFAEYRQAAVQSGAERYFVKGSFSWDDVKEFVKCHSA